MKSTEAGARNEQKPDIPERKPTFTFEIGVGGICINRDCGAYYDAPYGTWIYKGGYGGVCSRRCNLAVSESRTARPHYYPDGLQKPLKLAA